MRFEGHLLCAGLLLALGGCISDGATPSRSERAQEAEEAARVHTELGQRYLQNGDPRGALEKLNQALQFDPAYAPAHTVLALAYERLGDPVQAEQHYRKALQLEPGQGAASNNLGAFLCRQGQYAQAQGYFRQALADPLYRTPDVALVNAGSCLLKGAAPDPTAAEADFHKALTLNPDNADALFQIAKLRYLRNDVGRARLFIQRYDALDRPSPAALELGHDIESRLGNTDAALAYARRLQALFPDSNQAHALDAIASP